MTQHMQSNKATSGDLQQHYRNGKGRVTPQMYAALLDEVDEVTDQLSNTRTKLWQTQDELKDSEYVVLEMEKQVRELSKARDIDQESIKLLREANSAQVEEELRLRDSLELMKKVFTRTQLKTKEDHDKISDLKEEIELQLEVNQKLKGDLEELQGMMTNPSQFSAREKRLQDTLDKTRRDLESALAKQSIAEENIKIMQQRLTGAPQSPKTEVMIKKQQEEIEKLKKQLQQGNDPEGQMTAQRGVIIDPEVDKEDSQKRKSWFSFDYVTCNPRVASDEKVLEYDLEPVALEPDGESVDDTESEQREEGSVSVKDPSQEGLLNKLGLWARE